MTTQQRKETDSQKYRQKFKENPELHTDPLRRERARDSKRREVVKKMKADEDLKILARIRSKGRMQATRKRRKQEQVMQPVSNRSKSFTPLKTRLRVSGVFNDSDSDSDNESINEESPPSSLKITSRSMP
ncbi:hypothetical protein TNCT_654431 [Trichonephila clavata]|uniref:Uncharacterized protein n=1 Tax=Trichonephila clavata TaxID=2740835 RepID=A0A8X6F9Z0_TRICU|nr:hypothetical protein TNCT_654431 [Trichonephila clavata]